MGDRQVSARVAACISWYDSAGLPGTGKHTSSSLQPDWANRIGSVASVDGDEGELAAADDLHVKEKGNDCTL